MTKVKPKKRGKSGRNALVLIAVFFLASGLLRIGSGTGSAIAREVVSLRQTQNEETIEAQACETDEGISELLAAIKEREARVEKQEASIEERMKLLGVAEVSIKRNLAALVEAEEKLKATMALAETASEDDLLRLTSVYENMKAKDAVPLFEEMDPQFSAGFLGRMRPDAAAKIFAGLTPAKAYSISVILAGRNADVPTE